MLLKSRRGPGSWLSPLFLNSVLEVLPRIFFFFFLGPFNDMHLRHMEVSRLGTKLELQLPAYNTATPIQYPSHICNLHCSLWQHQILISLIKVRDPTCILMETSLVLNLLSHNGNSKVLPRVLRNEIKGIHV